MKSFKASRSQGFTLIELLAVLAILALVVAIATPAINSQVKKAKVNATKVQLSGLEQSLNAFNLDCGFFPSTEQGLEALRAAPTAGRQCKNYDPEGYLKKTQKLQDAFDQPFNYVSPGAQNPSSYDLSSPGPDQVPGNEDDINNWTADEK